ncbi:MAG: hypothetical protein M3Y27_23835 [Acidobacteriota bacterium]|nr:hypothetical protein [Acidobacteriota bacterium]
MADNSLQLSPEDARIDRAHARGFYRAVLLHRAFAVPMVFFKDGEVVEMSADDIPIPPEFDPRIQPPAEVSSAA